MKVLLHTCCAPCASQCIAVLHALNHEVTLFFSNANIAPEEEYQLRLDSVRQLANAMKVALIVDENDHAAWCSEVAQGFENEPERGARCTRCFTYSLQRTVNVLRNMPEYDVFTTSLSISPHKSSTTLFAIGRQLGGERFLAIDFKKKNGFQKSVEWARTLNLYRQRYCGCEWSIRP